MKLRFNYFILGIILGIVVLFSSPKPVSAFDFSLPSFPVLPSLQRLFNLLILRPLRPLAPLRPLRPGEDINPTPTVTSVPTPITITPSVIPTTTPTVTPTVTSTPVPTNTPTSTPTNTPTFTPTPTPTTTFVPPTQTPTSTPIPPTETPTPTASPIPPTETPTPTITPTPPTETSTPTPTEIPTLTPTTSPLESPTPTLTPTEGPTETPTSTPTETPIPPTPTETLTPTVTPTVAQGLLAHWKIETGDDNTVTDSSGHAYTLQLVGGPLLQDVAPSALQTTVGSTKSLYFDGTNYATLQNTANYSAFDFPTGFTMESWIKASSTQLFTNPVVISKQSGPMMWIDGGKIQNNIGYPATGTTNVLDDQWHHAAITWNRGNGGEQEVYVDGIREQFFAWGDPNFNPLWFGGELSFAYRYPGTNFVGNIDEIKIYNYVRTEAEIRQDAGITVVSTPTPTETLTPTPTETPTPTPTTTPTPQVVINEFMPNVQTTPDEWVEFYNPNNINISTFWIDDDDSFTVDSGNELKRSLSSINLDNPDYSYIEIPISFFNNDGDSVVLFSNDGSIIDQYTYFSNPGQDKSIGRNIDGTGTWKPCNAPSKGNSNFEVC